MLYSLYSFPNIGIPLLGGYIIDKLGKRIGLIMFTAFICAGQFLFVFSTYVACMVDDDGYSGRTLMLISRVVYGLGGENLTVATSAFIGVWFKGKELAFALGIDISCARIAAVANDFV